MEAVFVAKMDPDCKDLNVLEQLPSWTSAGKEASPDCHEGNFKHQDSSSPSITMQGGRKLTLPTFRIEGFVRGVTEGLERAAKCAADEQQRLEEGRRAEREEREKKTAMFATPGLPPLTMAPTLNWITLERTHVKSDLQFERLFPNDKAMRSRAKGHLW